MSIDTFLLSSDTTDLDYPEIRPTLDLNFARVKALDPRITFTRSSGGSYVGADGLIKLAGVNEARFDHDPVTGESLGLLIEESRTNLVLRSEEFDDAGWTKTQSSVSLNTATSPAGTLTADSLVENTASGQHFTSQTVTISANTIHTATVYVKANTRSSVRFGFLNNVLSNGAFAHFNVSTGAISTQTTAGTASNVSFNIETAVSGWYSCRVTCTVDSSSTLGTVFIGLVDGTNNVTYTGDGTSGVFVWGAQLEVGSFPTSYIPTVASTRTRAADNASITGKNFSEWYRQDEGTLYANARVNALGGSGFPGIAYVDDGTTGNCIGLVINDAGSDVVGAEAYVAFVNQYFISSSLPVVPNQLIKAITAYRLNNFTGAFNIGSNAVLTDTVGNVPTVNRLIIGDLRGNNGKLNGTISRLTYYPKRLTNAQLQALTR